MGKRGIMLAIIIMGAVGKTGNCRLQGSCNDVASYKRVTVCVDRIFLQKIFVVSFLAIFQLTTYIILEKGKSIVQNAPFFPEHGMYVPQFHIFYLKLTYVLGDFAYRAYIRCRFCAVQNRE